MITIEWISETNELIMRAESAGLTTLNGDLLIAKQPPLKVSKGGIHMPGIHGSLTSYFKGFARIIQVPVSGFASTNGYIEVPEEFRVGDFVLFNHASRYKPQPDVMNFLFESEVEEIEESADHNDEFHDRGQLFFVPFPDVKMIKPIEKVMRQLHES